MFKKKALALLLAAAAALTVFPPPVLTVETSAAESTATKKRVLLYSEDFESANPEIYAFGDYTGTKWPADPDEFRTATEDGNTFGNFYDTKTKKEYTRVGYEFSEDGITSGELDVKFRFKQGIGPSLSNIKWAQVLIGENDIKGSFLQLVAYNKNAAVKTLDDTKYTLLNPIVDGTWYKYEAKLDLSNHKMTATLKNNDDTVIQTFADISVPNHNTKEFNNWPVNGSNTKFKVFGVSIDMAVDDIEIYGDPIEVTDAKFMMGKGLLTFDHRASLVEDGAVTIDGEALPGKLSEDGFQYTFDLPSDLEGGKQYTVKVDQSKIKMKAVQESVVDVGDNLFGEGTKEFSFTAVQGLHLYSEDFESDKPEIHAFGNETGAYLSDATYMDNKELRFKVAKDAAGTENSENRYGGFYPGPTASDNDFYRVGYQFCDEGITKGKVRVKFKFRSNAGTRKYGLFLLGNNANNNNWLSCVGFNTGGASPVKMVDDASLKFVDKYQDGTWYSYDATIDLDNKSIDACLYNTDGKLVKNLTWAAAGKTGTRTGQFDHWPDKTSTFSIKSFAAYVNIDLDDIEIYTDQPIEVSDIKLVRNDGAAYTDTASFLTARSGQLTFNYKAADVETGAVKIDGANAAGELSADGYTYTFAIPSNLVAGRKYTVKVDQSKIRMKPAAEGDTAHYGEGEKTFEFTPNDVISFSQDFESDVDIYTWSNNGTSSKVTDANKYERKTAESNSYGHFCEDIFVSADTGDKDTDTEGEKKYYYVDWGRRTVNFDENGVTDGKLKVHFRFRPTDTTFAVLENVKMNVDGTKGDVGSFGTVIIGNNDQKGANGVGHITTSTNAMGNWLSLVNVDCNGNLKTLGFNDRGIELTDSKSNAATVEKNKWYICDAIIDLDAHALDVKVVEEGTKTVYRASGSGLTPRTSEWGTPPTAVWPTATQPCFKSFGVIAAMDIDDITIQTDYSPSLTTDADKLTVKITTERESSYMLIVQYDENDRVVAVKETTFAREGTASVYSEDINWASGATRAKAFIWDNLNNANPLEKCAEITKP